MILHGVDLMKKTLKPLSILLALLIVFAVGVAAISAADEVGDPNTPAVDDPGYSGEPADPVDPDPGYSEEPADPVDPDPGYSEEPADPVDPDPGYSDGSGGTDTTGETPQYFNDDEDPLWYGDPADYSYNYDSNSNNASAGSVSDSTKLFDTSGSSKVDTTPNKWTNITLDEKTAKSSAGSFSAIKSNTDKNDNGQWILYLGYALVILSLLGILYFIVATISARKQNAREIRHNSGAGSSEAYTKLDKPEPQKSKNDSRRSAGHYADGYEGYSSRKASKADTGEIYVPRRAK